MLTAQRCMRVGSAAPPTIARSWKSSGSGVPGALSASHTFTAGNKVLIFVWHRNFTSYQIAYPTGGGTSNLALQMAASNGVRADLWTASGGETSLPYYTSDGGAGDWVLYAFQITGGVHDQSTYNSGATTGSLTPSTSSCLAFSFHGTTPGSGWVSGLTNSFIGYDEVYGTGMYAHVATKSVASPAATSTAATYSGGESANWNILTIMKPG